MLRHFHGLYSHRPYIALDQSAPEDSLSYCKLYYKTKEARLILQSGIHIYNYIIYLPIFRKAAITITFIICIAPFL